MDLPSFIWLWRIAAWSMGFTIAAYLIQILSGSWIFYRRRQNTATATKVSGLVDSESLTWVPSLHLLVGIVMVGLVLLLLAIGIVGTLGEYGHLGQSAHLVGGVGTVSLVVFSAWSATQIRAGQAWARPVHIGLNAILCMALIFVTWSGWSVVQKYLP